MSKTYMINEIFYSPQGEGVRAGIMHVFIRFTGCNMLCDIDPGPKSPGGFTCDTEFTSGRPMTLEEINDAATELLPPKVPWKPWLLLTGGEPGLQVDAAFCNYMHEAGWFLAIETNGSIHLPHREAEIIIASTYIAEALERIYLLDWITISPKVAEHAIKQVLAHEVKYVRAHGQAIPKTKVRALHQLISPAFDGVSTGNVAQLQERHLAWCIQLVHDHPHWRLSVQQHKLWRIR